jgi:hypothetical protein
MTRNGSAFELPTWARHIIDSGFLFSVTGAVLRTPMASETKGGAVSPEYAAAKRQTLRLTGQILSLVGAPVRTLEPELLPTPTVVMRDLVDRGEDYHANLNEAIGALLAEQGKLLPTPDVSSGQRSRESYESAEHQISIHQIGDLLADSRLLPTTRAAMGETRNSNIYDRPGASNLENVVDKTGVRLSRRSGGGNVSLDDQLPLPLWQPAETVESN